MADFNYKTTSGSPLLPLFTVKGFSRPYSYAHTSETWFIAAAEHCNSSAFCHKTVSTVFARPFRVQVRARDVDVPNFDDWVLKFNENRAEALRRAKYSGCHDSVHSSFVKKDKQILGEYKVPRCVVASSDATIANLGPWYAAYSKQLKDHFVKVDSPILWAAGTNGERLGSWFNHWYNIIKPGWYYTSDFSKYDRSVNYIMLNWEWENYFHAMTKAEKKKHRQDYLDQIFVRIKGLGGCGSAFRFGGRQSGCLNTCIGNCLVHTHALEYFLKQEGLVLGKDVAVCILGDDMLCLSRDKFPFAKYEKFCSLLGWKLKYTHTDQLAKVDFCQKLFYPTTDGYMPGPKIGRYLSKIGWSFKMIDPKTAFYSEDLNHVPILNTLPAVSSNRVYQDWEVLNQQVHHMTDETKEFFHTRYGFYPDGYSYKNVSEVADIINKVDNDHNVSNGCLDTSTFAKDAISKLTGVNFEEFTKKKTHISSILEREEALMLNVLHSRGVSSLVKRRVGSVLQLIKTGKS